MDNNYNVDDILSEIKKKKSRQKAGAEPISPAAPPTVRPEGEFRFSPPEEEPRQPPAAQGEPDQPDLGFQFEPPIEPEKKRANPMEFTGHVQSIADKAKRRPTRLNPPGQRPAAQPQFEFRAVEADAGEELPQPIPKKPDRADFSAFQAPKKGDDQHTRVLPKFPTGKDIDVEELQQRGISAAAESDYADGYYEDEDYPADTAADHTAVDFSEYNSVKDRRDVATDIARVKLWLFVRASVTTLLAGLLLYLTLAGKYVMPLPAAIDPLPDTMRMYLLTGTILTVLVALINSSAVGGGLISLVKMRANSDTLATLAVLAAVGQGVACVVKPGEVNPAALNVYFFVAALAMLFNALGKMTMINRIQQNFRLIASDKPKKALITVESDEFCREFVPEATRKPTIALGVKAEFFTDFLGLSYSDKYDVGINRAVAPVCLISSLIVGVVCYLLTGEILAAVSATTAVLCVAATLSATFIENIPLGKLTKKLAPLGGMVSGNKAVEDFCDTEALILTENDLFPDGNIRLRGIKAFSQSRIDEAILDAASVICSLEGALSPVFLQMIGGNRKLLKKVDNVVFENGMGVSAWVDSRRVLIGNRTLMQNHGITLPPEAYKPGHTATPEDGELLYLSNSGEASAQFAVSYHIDEELAEQLDLLAVKNKILIVHACDANITAHRVWELYGYPEELVRILPAERHGQYRQMAAPRENAIAEIVYTGRASTMTAAIVACINARGSILSATVLQLSQIVLGYGLVAFMAFMGAIGSLTITQLCIYQIFWFAAVFIVQKSRQP